MSLWTDLVLIEVCQPWRTNAQDEQRQQFKFALFDVQCDVCRLDVFSNFDFVHSVALCARSSWSQTLSRHFLVSHVKYSQFYCDVQPRRKLTCYPVGRWHATPLDGDMLPRWTMACYPVGRWHAIPLDGGMLLRRTMTCGSVGRWRANQLDGDVRISWTMTYHCKTTC